MSIFGSIPKLAIELDGSQHYEPKGQIYDNRRTEHLNRMGITVLRFSNTDVMRNLTGVCQMIDMTVNERMIAPCGGTLPFGEGS